MALMDQLMELATAQMTGAATKKTGLSETAAAKAMPMAMAVLMNGLKKNAATPGGAEALAAALQKHDGGIVDAPDRLANDDVLADGEKILGHILGANRGAAEQEIAAAAGGIDKGQVASLLAMAAPTLLGALGKAQKDQGLDASKLAALVNQEANSAAGAAPASLSGVMKLLDADGDGTLNNEAMGIGKRLLSGLFGRR